MATTWLHSILSRWYISLSLLLITEGAVVGRLGISRSSDPGRPAWHYPATVTESPPSYSRSSSEILSTISPNVSIPGLPIKQNPENQHKNGCFVLETTLSTPTINHCCQCCFRVGLAVFDFLFQTEGAVVGRISRSSAPGGAGRALSCHWPGTVSESLPA